jgi:hypothetical protein
LWNLRERRCPECGDGFQIREYEFAPSSVQFCCPHCMQAYYGLSATGHLIPDEFACVKCANVVHMESMVLLPTQGVKEEQTRAMTIPWVERRARGRWSAWISTIGWGFARPADIGRLLKGEPKPGDALSFGLVTMSAATFLMAIVPFILCGVMFASIGGGGGGGGPFVGSGVLAMLISGLFGLVSAFVVVNICALLSHAILWTTGNCSSTVGGTVEAMNYTTGPFIMCAIPCVGVYILPISWIWWAVACVLSVKHRQEVSVWRACVAVLVPLIGFPALGFALWFAGMMISASAAISATNAMPSSFASIYVDDVRDALDEYVQRHPGGALGHPLELIAENLLTSEDFIPGWNLSTDMVPVGRSTLDEFEFWILSGNATREEIAGAIQAEIDALPEGATAIRLAEFVFPYYGDSILPPGFGTDAAPGALWLFMTSAAKDLNSRGTADNTITVHRVDGTMTEYRSRINFAEALVEQNALRASEGLPELGHPGDVKHVGK